MDVYGQMFILIKKPAIAIIQKKLEADKDLHLRTTMSPKQIISLLEFG